MRTLQPDLQGRYRYRIVGKPIGQGGFGSVYEARDEHFHARVVAIKELSTDRLDPAEKARALQDFNREAELLESLNHGNLPRVYDFFEEGGKAYLVMEYIQGQSLEKLLEDTRGPLDEQRVMRWALQLCYVLTYLHTQSPPIVFRDLKPSNIMLTPQEQIKLIDFGIARVFKPSAAKDTAMLGSRGFASPEQYGMGQSDARSDIYSLGATLYNLLTNVVPLEAPVRMVNVQALELPRQLNPWISPGIEHILLKALSLKPDNRFQTAAMMRQAIIDGDVPLPAGSALVSSHYHAMHGAAGSSAPPTGRVQQASVVQTTPPLSQVQVGTQTPPSLQPATPSTPSRRRFLWMAGVGLVAVAGVGAYAVTHTGAGQTPATTSSVTGPTLTLDFVYSTEKDQWLQHAIDAFHSSKASKVQGKNIRINFTTSGSLDLTSNILDGQSKPIAWSPASSLEVNRLNSAWQQKHNGQDIVVSNELVSLVLSPLVFAIWQSRAEVLLKKYQSIDWESIYAALTLKNGWSDIGGPADWQRVSLGQTRPDQSNSGLLTITLMAYAYYKKSQGLAIASIDDPGFLHYLYTFEDAVTAFGRSSGTYLENEVIVKGPGTYDVTFTYENLVLTALNEIKVRQGEALRLFYPHLTIVSDHPFVLLQAPWVTQEMQNAARAFRQFLLDTPQQKLALQYGLRPTSQNVHITDAAPNNLFLAPDMRNDIKSDYRSVQLPPGSVVDGLLFQWEKKYHDAATGNG